MQEIRLEGNIGQNAQVKTSQNNGKQFATFSLGCSEKSGKKLADGRDEYITTWYEVFCKPEEVQYLTKGRRVCVTGKPSFRAYTNKDGQAVCQCSVQFANIYFSMPRVQQQNGQPAQQPQQPAQQYQQPAQPQYQYQQPPAQINNPAMQTLQDNFGGEYQETDNDPELPF